jgi:hypothetical protein
VLSQLGIEGRLVQYLVALFIVLLLVGLFALILRRITGGRMGLSAADRGRTRQPRLGIVDVYDLDRQRQLVLLRRDNVEHLLLLGGPNDLVVETNIMRAGATRPAQAAAPEAAPALPERVVPPLEAPPAPPERTLPDRTRERPAPELAVAEGPSRPILEPPIGARVNAPEPTPPAAVTADPLGDLVERTRNLRPEAPLVVDPNPAAEAPPAAPPAAAPEAVAAPAAPPASRATIATPRPPSPRPAEPVPAPRAGNDGDAAVLSDMARQLEEALRRPSAPQGAPRPAQAARPPEPPRPAPPPAVAPQADAPDTAALEPPAPPRPAPVQPPAPRPVAPAPAPPPARSAPPGTVDPFSVDEIEAEFARLLGRSPDKS